MNRRSSSVLLVKTRLTERFCRYIFEAGSSGLLPKDLAVKLERFKVMRHQVSRRILRMNKRIEKEFGEQIVEKRGWRWVLTSFAVETWGKTNKDN